MVGCAVSAYFSRSADLLFVDVLWGYVRLRFLFSSHCVKGSIINRSYGAKADDV